MAGEWTKIEPAFKKLAPAVKNTDPGKATRLVKQVKDALDVAWKAEDKFTEALKAARASGLKGKKPADFNADPGFKSAYGVLVKAASAHHDAVKALQSVSDEAVVLHKGLTKLLGDIKKQITKGDKQQKLFQAKVIEADARVKKVADSIGKLTAPQLFYGAQFNRVVDRIINKSKGSGPSGDATKLIEQKERAKNLKAAEKLAKKISDLCDACLKWAQANPTKPSAPHLNKVAKLIKKLKAIDIAYLTVKKKNLAMIKQSRDKANILKDISSIAGAHTAAVNKFSDTINKIKEQ